MMPMLNLLLEFLGDFGDAIYDFGKINKNIIELDILNAFELVYFYKIIDGMENLCNFYHTYEVYDEKI